MRPVAAMACSCVECGENGEIDAIEVIGCGDRTLMGSEVGDVT